MTQGQTSLDYFTNQEQHKNDQKIWYLANMCELIKEGA